MILSGRVRAWIIVAFAMLLAVLLAAVPAMQASAAQITPRVLTLSTSAPSATASHTFAFTVPSVGNTNIGSIQFEYCTTSTGTCGTVAGLNTSSATVTAQSGATGFTINNGTARAPFLTRTGAAVTAGTALSYTLGNITNPSTTNQSFFVRITTYTAASLGGSVVDTGIVVGTTATQIVLTGVMPESIIFCAGGAITVTLGIPDCSTATSGAINFNQLFSTTAAATATSQFAASTNAVSGYAITVSGVTMTSGSNTIPAMAGGTPAVGNSQFGMNLVANTTAVSTPAVGAAITAAANGTTLKGQALAGYNTPDSFKFVPAGDTVANSANGGAGPTNSQLYTASYIVNVAGGQTAGTYTTTLTYVCTATF